MTHGCNCWQMIVNFLWGGFHWVTFPGTCVSISGGVGHNSTLPSTLVAIVSLLAPLRSSMFTLMITAVLPSSLESV